MDDNKRNLVWFEAPTMRGLFDAMDTWQTENRKRLQSVSVQHDGGAFCCIALTNPAEVVITSRFGSDASVTNGSLHVYNWGG